MQPIKLLKFENYRYSSNKFSLKEDTASQPRYSRISNIDSTTPPICLLTEGFRRISALLYKNDGWISKILFAQYWEISHTYNERIQQMQCPSLIKQQIKSLLTATLCAALLTASVYGFIAVGNQWEEIEGWDLNVEQCSQICSPQSTEDETNKDNCCLDGNCNPKRYCKYSKLQLYCWLFKALLFCIILFGIGTIGGLGSCVLACCKGKDQQGQMRNQRAILKQELQRQRQQRQQVNKRSLLSQSILTTQRKITGDHTYYDAILRTRVKCLGRCAQCSC